MCGFVATVGNYDITESMRRIAHRGIRQGVMQTSFGTIGHVRLPIVGLSEEFDQPIAVDEWRIAFVGEILDFNREEDACDLHTVAREWSTQTEFGFIDHDGFWSIAALNEITGHLHLMCDYLAQKPTYYRISGVIAAASELDPLTVWDVTLDQIYLSAVIKWGYCPEPRRTPYNEIKRVLPGEHVVLFSGGVLERDVVDPLKPHYDVDLKAEIEAAVRRRVLSSDVPVACLLSGGLDSSIVYTLAKRYGDVRAYYASDGDLGEKLAVSAVIGSGAVTEISWDDVDIETALIYMQEPVDIGSLIPQVALSDQVKERVCLTGDGADEFFGGYGRAQRYDSQASDIYHELICWHLPRLDRVMMRNQVEIRSPFLARKVAGAALALPREQRTGKKILRDLFRNDLPPGLADSPKRPLRTKEVEFDREANSIKLVDAFMHSWR